MKKENFRSVSFWKSVVLSAADNSFFELLRSVFGTIKTPFNKQQLLNDLEKFLLREDIQNAIYSYIDETDAKIIAAVSLFGEPAPEQLEIFFSDEFSYAQLLDIIVNMEERFILYRFHEEKTSSHTSSLHTNSRNTSARLALNPVLKQVLLPFMADTSRLFPPAAADKDTDSAKEASGANSSEPEPKILFNDLLFAGILSFASQWQPFYKTDSSNKNVIRKRVIAAGKTCFPGIDLNQIITSSFFLGLFYIDDCKLVPDKKHLDDFSLLTARERSEYFTAVLIISGELSANEILPPLYRGRIRELVNFIHSLLNMLNSKSQYPENTLKRMIEVLKIQTGVNIITEKLLELLKKTGLIIYTTSYTIKTGAVIHNNTKEKEKPLIALDSGFSILVYPEIDFKDAISIASFASIHETGSSLITPIFRFELNKDSAVRAFDNNITSDQIIELLNKLSGEKTDDSLVWNLKDWEKRHSEVSLKKGVILQLSEEHRYLTETKTLAPLITETLAPGLYLLNEDAAEEAVNALNSAGIDIIGRRKQINKKINSFSTNFFPSPSVRELSPLYYLEEDSFSDSQFDNLNPQVSTSNSKISFQDNKFASALTEKLHATLKKMQLTEAEKSELSARIDRRLVLCDTQLKEASLRFEKIEAKLMDYTGKQNIAKQAISQQSPLEVICPKQSAADEKNSGLPANKQPAKKPADEEKLFGIPKALEKKGDELILVIDTSSEIRRIPLAKIIKLRRIKKSIFEI